MSKKAISGFLTYAPRWDEFSFHTYDPSKFGTEWVVVRPHVVEVDAPDDFDPREKQIAALKREQDKTRAEMTARITELQEQIDKLQAITYEAPEVKE